MGEKLLPCPFCGGTPTTKKIWDKIRIACCECNVGAEWWEDEYIEKWNKRPSVSGGGEGKIEGLELAIKIIRGMGTDWPDSIGHFDSFPLPVVSTKDRYAHQFIQRIQEKIAALKPPVGE